jgi:hypothetical protein
VRKLLRRQSKDFYAAGFDAVLKRWDKCLGVFSRFEIHMFYVLYPFVIYLLTSAVITSMIFRCSSKNWLSANICNTSWNVIAVLFLSVKNLFVRRFSLKSEQSFVRVYIDWSCGENFFVFLYEYADYGDILPVLLVPD